MHLCVFRILTKRNPLWIVIYIFMLVVLWVAGLLLLFTKQFL